MKIALLAPSNAGKTAYLTGLYGVLTDILNDSVYGINFQVTDVVKKHELSKRYDRLVDAGDFGKGSSDLSVYPLTLSTHRDDNSTAQLRIEIVDFPGEDLHGSTPERARRVEEITQILSECDGFIVLVDGDVFVTDARLNSTKLRKDLKANDVREVLYSALHRRRINASRTEVDPDAYAFGKGMTPVIFAMTKGDLVEEGFSPSQDKIVSTVKELCRGLAGDGYREDEGPIANLIRSQFGKIIGETDVVSAIASITVYDPKTQSFAPRNLEYLLQFVLFQGLLNANLEYAKRSGAWQVTLNGRNQELKNAKAELARAEREVEALKDLPFFWKVASNIGYVIGRIVDENNLDNAKASMNAATMERNQTQRVRDVAVSHHQDAMLFLTRILPDELVYRLGQSARRHGFYQHGLPIDALSQEDWWQRKYRAGEGAIHRQEAP